MTELTDYQRGLIDGFVSGLKPQRKITNNARHAYNIKHDFEALLRMNNEPAYISQEFAEQLLKSHGFQVKHHYTNINNSMATEDTRRRLDKSENGIIVMLDWSDNTIN
ncbi:hypothetical protein AB3K25_04340 [Leuconostoc sp. MS02]|uniref:Uncharacterized protein n=1 Tax=Leuconostoc aquikimchii TaxID=3236804 RepID=A0ABV3S584_9LACO